MGLGIFGAAEFLAKNKILKLIYCIRCDFICFILCPYNMELSMDIVIMAILLKKGMMDGGWTSYTLQEPPTDSM